MDARTIPRDVEARPDDAGERARVATLITLDSVVTLIQAVGYDLPRHSAPLDWVVMLIAVLAPTFAAILLWSGRAHRRARGAIGA